VCGACAMKNRYPGAVCDDAQGSAGASPEATDFRPGNRDIAGIPALGKSADLHRLGFDSPLPEPRLTK